MTLPTPTTDEQIFEDDVNYGIADCRRRSAQARRARARSQQSTLRAQHPPKYNLDELPSEPATEQLNEREEALIT